MTVVEDRPKTAARKAMIDSQLRTSGVNAEFVLRRMAAVAREDFVPAAAKGVAYMDRAIALGDGRWLAAPVVQGMMLQEAVPTLGDKVLLVDGGSGYLAALVEPLAGSLDVIAPDEALKSSRKKDYTLLLVDGAVEQLPESLTGRLAADGRLVCGMVRNGLTRLAIGRKSGDDVALRALAEVGIPALPEFVEAKAWSF